MWNKVVLKLKELLSKNNFKIVWNFQAHRYHWTYICLLGKVFASNCTSTMIWMVLYIIKYETYQCKKWCYLGFYILHFKRLFVYPATNIH